MLFLAFLLFTSFVSSLTLYKAASNPTYLERGGRNQPAPQFSARSAPIGQMMNPAKTFSVNVVYKKRIWSIGQSGRKIDFQEFLLGFTKIDIARWFLDQLTQFFLQMQAKTYIYVMIGQFWV